MSQKLKAGVLEQNISDLLLGNGAVSVGFATRETLADSPPSADITYLMENGLSAVSFAVPTPKEHIRPYLAKEDRLIHEREDMETAVKARDLGNEVVEMLKAKGHQAMRPSINLRYRTEMANWGDFLPPDISHRYMALASGAGSLGWSGNVGVKGYGTAITLATVLTDALLSPTSPIPPEENFCSDCKACAGACPYEMFSSTEETSVTLGGREYTFAARIELIRCQICCGGATGLHKSKQWSSWSPGRYQAPEDKKAFLEMLIRANDARQNWPPVEGEALFKFNRSSRTTNPDVTPRRANKTCGTCSLVCTGDKEENLENLRILRSSGCVIQYPDGRLVALPPDEAEAEFNKMPAEHRALYC